MSNSLNQLKEFNTFVNHISDWHEPPRKMYPPQPSKSTKELDPKKWRKRQLQKQARKKARK